VGLLIDTSIVVELERRGEADLVAAISGFAIDDEPTALSVVSATELLVGVHRAEPESRRALRSQIVEGLLGSIQVLAFDVDVARTHARLWAELLKTGRTPPDRDLIIASTAVHYDLELLTANVRDFIYVPRLIIRQPVW
jgi:predicted nucleic acid-binding protein